MTIKKLDEYYNHVIAGIELFESPKGTMFHFEKWVAEVYEWLQAEGVSPTVVFDWFSLNMCENIKPESILNEPDKLNLYLKSVSERFCLMEQQLM